MTDEHARLRGKLEKVHTRLSNMLARWPADGDAPDLDAIERLSLTVLSVTTELDAYRLEELLAELEEYVTPRQYAARSDTDD